MEEDDTIIIQVIFKFEDGRLYNFDVDLTTTFCETKKILSNAAHILKNSFTVYHEGQEFSSEYDDQPLQKIFPTLKKIEFFIKLKKEHEEQDENEHDQISVKYNIKEPCKEHIGKFLVLYCISCKKSICNECFSISHNNHEVEEKSDYLMPAKILMERIFANSFMFKTDPKLSNYMSCVSFRSIIKVEVFDRLRQLVNELESKCINCLEFFSFNEDSTEKNNDLNLELLKKYCTLSFIKLKNNIDTKQILINDEVFLSLYNKLKAIKNYEISLFTENINKYKALNQFFLPFTQEIKNMSIDLNNILSRYINKDIYSKFKEDISKNTVDVVQKEDVIRFMFENINIPKSTLIRAEEKYNKNSHTPNVQRILPSILLFNETRNNNNNIKNTNNNNINNFNNNISNPNNISINTISNNSNIISNSISNNIPNTSNTNISNMTNINTINKSSNYQQSNQNFTISNPIYFSKITNNNNSNINNMNINLSDSNNNNTNINNINMNLSNSKINNNMNIINNMNSMNMNLSNIQNITNNINTNMANLNNRNSMHSKSSINENMNNINNNISNNFLFVKNISECTHETTISKEEKEKVKTEKIDKMELEETGETHPTQNSPNAKNEIIISQVKIEEMKSNLNDNKNLCASPLVKKSFISIHLSPNNINKKNEILSKSFIQQKNIPFQNESKHKNNLEIPTIKKNIEQSSQIKNNSTFQNSINNANIFNGKLIDVLNKEIDNSISGEVKTEKKEENIISQESPIFSKKFFSEINKDINTTTDIISNFNSTSIINYNNKYNSQKIENSQLNLDLNTPQKKIPIIFMYPVFKSNIIKCALDKNTVHEIKINFSDFSKKDPIITEFPNGGAYCHYKKFLYFTGGQEYIKEAGKLFLSIVKNNINQNAIKLPLMKNNHFNHSMIADKEKIYVIGGYDSNKCEVFDIANNKWNEMPDLNSKERQRSMLYIDNNYLYCFMGLSQNGILDSVERINLENIDAGWSNIIIDNCDDINLKFYGAGIIRKNQSNKIYFIGGKKENKKKENVFKRSIYEFSFDDCKMVISDFKIENDLIFVENKLYFMDDDDYGNFINIGNGFLISMPNLGK